MVNIKLIFSDVDNTLICHGKGFTKKLKTAMKKCSENNIEFVLCSGRPTPNLINVATELNNDGLNLKYVAGFNGCEIYDLENQEYIYQDIITDASTITNKLEEFEIDYLLYNNDTIYSTNLLNEYSIHEANLTQLKIEEVKEVTSSPKVLGLVNPIDMPKVLKKVQSSLDDYTVVNSTPYFIEITNKGVDKGAGLLKMAQILDIHVDDVMCFGDAGNDYSMFNVCKNGIAVANATDEIKAQAAQIIDSVKEDGVANFILRHLGE